MQRLIVAVVFCVVFAVTAKAAGRGRQGIGIEVNKGGVKILANYECFGDHNPRRFEIDDLPKSDDFQKLLRFALWNKETTIITFLVWAEGAETYKEAQKLVEAFEREHLQELSLSQVDRYCSLSGKSPRTKNTDVRRVLREPPIPREVPRSKGGVFFEKRTDRSYTGWQGFLFQSQYAGRDFS